MRSKKYFSRNNKTLKNKITKYLCKKKDICCEEDIDRKLAIEDIFALYREVAEFFFEKDEYLSYINNDLLIFIGYRINLEKKGDIEGVKLWDEINNKLLVNKKSNEKKIVELLNEVPLYYLLSFLGYAYYRYKRNKNILNILDKTDVLTKKKNTINSAK